MNKKIFSSILIVAVFIIVVFMVREDQQPENEAATILLAKGGEANSDIHYFYGQECSHSKNVEKFISENKVEEKIFITKKEVWHNTENESDMQIKAMGCGLSSDKVGVPFLFARGKCYVGEIEVKKFLQMEIGM